MEERKTIFDYLSQIFMIYGITIAMMNVFCVFFGEGAREISAMFALGNKGLSIPIMIQFFWVSVILVTLRFLFFTDKIIKKMPVIARTVCMLVLVVAVMVVFILCFDWFPADMWQSWAMFILCFGLSFIASFTVTLWKEKLENKKMAEALERLKQKQFVRGDEGGKQEWSQR